MLAVGLIIREYQNYGGIVPLRAINMQTRIRNLVPMFIQRFSTISVGGSIVEYFDNMLVFLVFIPVILYCLYVSLMILYLLYIHILTYLRGEKETEKAVQMNMNYNYLFSKISINIQEEKIL